jgi:hypothetical protein
LSIVFSQEGVDSKVQGKLDVTNIVDQHVPVDEANANTDSSTMNATKGDNTDSGREKSSATLDSEVVDLESKYVFEGCNKRSMELMFHCKPATHASKS